MPAPHCLPRLLFLCVFACPSAQADFVGPYELQNFTKSAFENIYASGSTTMTPSSGSSASAEFGYSIFDALGVEPTLGTFSATAAQSGTVRFDYDYSGFHAYYLAYAEFEVLVNGEVVLDIVDHESVSGSFEFTGSRSFTVNAGDVFAFRVGGQHGDSNGNLNGTLSLSNFFAPDLLVSNTNDSGAGSLRQAITDVTSGASIQFDPAVFTGGSANEIVLGSQLSIPNKTVQIDGSSVGGVTLDADGNDRVIHNGSGGSLHLAAMGITGGNTTGLGGGIANGGSSVDVRECAIYGNACGNAGGGFINYGGGSATLINTTIYNNSAEDFSGGVENNGAGATATLIHCSVVGNSSPVTIGGVGNNGGNLTLSHTVITGNTAPSRPDVYQTTAITYAGPNFIGDNSGSGMTDGNPNGDGNFVGTSALPLDAGLLSFGTYGGGLPGLLPRFDSALVDAGTESAATPATDQRGFSRIGGSAPDLGALESSYLLATEPPVPFVDNINRSADTLAVSEAGSVNLTSMKDGDLISQGAHSDGRNTDFLFGSGSISGVSGIPDGTTLFPRSCVSGLRVTIGNPTLTEAPTSFLLFGSNGGGPEEYIASGSLPAFTESYLSHTVFFEEESEAYSDFILRFPTNGGNSIVTLADVQLLGRPEIMKPENYTTAHFTVDSALDVSLAWPAQPFGSTLLQVNSVLEFPVANLRPANDNGDGVASFAGSFAGLPRYFFRAVNSAPLFLLDIDQVDAASGLTENGFTRLSDPALTATAINVPVTLSASDGGVTVTVANGNQFRDRDYVTDSSDPNDLGSQPFPHLLRDFIALDEEGGSLDVTISGLPAGYYEVTTFHFDRGVFAENNDFRLEITDASGTSTGTTMAMPDLSEPITGVLSYVQSNGSDDVIIRVREQSENNRCRLNGIAVTPLAKVPGS
ncbi:MAG: choice-of-anchor Q domain-containing protein [Verrucomicrobiales bacterium]